jgi:PPOX class probable F420-dependent enzyme
MPSDPPLSALQRAFIGSARRAVLATIAPDAHARLVPICFSLDDVLPILYTPIDDKAKRTNDPLALARVHDLQGDPRVTILVDRWDEDWSRLGWVRGEGRAVVLDPAAGRTDEHAAAVSILRAKYRQYETHRLEARPIIRITLERVTSWGRLDES